MIDFHQMKIHRNRSSILYHTWRNIATFTFFVCKAKIKSLIVNLKMVQNSFEVHIISRHYWTTSLSLKILPFVQPSTCPQLYLDNRLIDLIDILHSDSVYNMWADAWVIQFLTRSDVPDLQTFNRPNFIHIL